MTNLLSTYFKAIQNIPGDATEHTLRAPLQNLLAGLIAEHAPEITVIHEPKPDPSGGGAPDFKFKRNEAIVGYLETKRIGAPLDDVLKSDQIEKYQGLSGNIILTDYLQYIWLKDGRVNKRETLCYPSDAGNPRARLDVDKAAAVQSLLLDFLSTPPAALGDARQLSEALAKRCHDLRDFLSDALQQQEDSKERGRLHALCAAFKRDVFHELSLTEFADAFAQTLGYGLFLAKLNAGADKITLRNAEEHVPGNFALIRELVGFLKELNEPEYHAIKWLVEEILSIMNTLDLSAIYETLSFNGSRTLPDEESQLLFAKDPYVYFYEDFLKAYDENTRQSRGVYYTPPPVVNFIVRAVDDILRETFAIGDGLADYRRVTVLDFATGTGTFLLEVLQRIFENVDRGVYEQIVREHVLKNLYGFEYLIAPYTVAHLKLSQFLRDKGYALRQDQRLQVYLTNTLEPIAPQQNLWMPALSREVEAAQAVKEKPLLVIIGNPPYSAISKNKGDWIRELINTYKYVNGKHFNERKHWLDDDYVKFIRFAQHKMEAVKEGVVGVITNHSFLDNLTFRGMRWSLMQTFDQLYFIDLHGSAKKEQMPEGGKDENVFDIQQGVAISLMVKKPGVKKAVYHADLWGHRREKYTTLLETDKNTMPWKTLQPSAPSYFFTPVDETGRKAYEKGYSIADIFDQSISGIVTMGDNFIIANNRETLTKRLENFLRGNISEPEFKGQYKLGKNYAKWVISNKSLLELDDTKCIPIAYRPFDIRYTYFDNKLIWRWREKIMRHMLAGENLALSATRQVKRGQSWQHCLITNTILESTYISNRTSEIGYLFPLYLYPPPVSIEHERRENITPDFRKFIDQHYGHHYPPETILGYIYAVLHCPSYRERYREFLKRDFPRIPFIDDRQTFDTLAQLGGELLDAHRLKTIPDVLNVTTPVAGDFNVAKPKYDDKNERLYVNATQYFTPVPQNVWEFHIGGYKVLDKYLKSRKNRHLALDEINHLKNIIQILRFTIDQMQRIDMKFI